MRVDAKWTPSEIGLWLIAAVIATVLVCNEVPRRDSTPDPQPGGAHEIEFEVETAP